MSVAVSRLFQNFAQQRLMAISKQLVFQIVRRWQRHKLAACAQISLSKTPVGELAEKLSALGIAIRQNVPRNSEGLGKCCVYSRAARLLKVDDCDAMNVKRPIEGLPERVQEQIV